MAAGAAGIYLSQNEKSVFGSQYEPRFLPSDFEPTKENFALAVEQNKMSRATQILQRFPSDQEQMEALKFRNCHHATPFQDSAERDNIKLAKLQLKILSNKEFAHRLVKNRFINLAKKSLDKCIHEGQSREACSDQSMIFDQLYRLEIQKTKEDGLELLRMKEDAEILDYVDVS